jgi:uncharacterized protein
MTMAFTHSAVILGIVFGFLWQKGHVAKCDVVMEQCLFRGWAVVKRMGRAVVVRALGVRFLVSAGLTSLPIRPALFGGVLLVAVCFGIAMAVFGDYPGTRVAACGEGWRDAWLALLPTVVAGGFALFLDRRWPSQRRLPARYSYQHDMLLH